jgi:hypothetical protein
MIYQEAEDKALTVKWKIGTCGEGEKCWCRTIIPVEPILYSEYQMIDTESEYMIVGSGEMNKSVAERIVEDHNVIVALSEAMEVEVARLKAKLNEVDFLQEHLNK